MRRLRWQLGRGVILASVFVLVSHPVLVAAQPVEAPQPDARSIMIQAGDRYLTSASATVRSAAELMRLTDQINRTSIQDLSESDLAAAQAQAVDLAAQAAESIGATADLAQSVAALDDSYFAPVDLGDEAAKGLPDQLASDLQDLADLSPSQVGRVSDALASISDERLGFSGLPAETRAGLADAGLSTAEVDRIQSSVADRGLADGGISNALEQFRAAQDEFAGVRARALMLDSQLLARQIAARQAQGIAPRPVSQAELDALANDELRLLIHISQLQSLWGDDPSQDVGEGQWWFVERYASRSAERLRSLTLDSQNLGLIGELFLMRNLSDLARTARTGDAGYAKRELDSFAVLLQVAIGDETFVSQHQVTGVGKALASLAARPELREVIDWPVSTQDRSAYVAHARDRLDRQGVRNLLDLIGGIEESDETNNELDYLFAAGLPYFGQLSADILLGALNVIALVNRDNVEKWLTAILTGETDDPALLIGSVLFGLLPVIGVIQDVYTLVTDPSIFIKAISLIGVVGGIVELSSFIPGLQPVGVGGILGKAASTVMKGLESAAEAVRPILHGVARALKLEDAFNAMTDLLRLTLKGVSGFPTSLDELVNLVQGLFGGARHLWDDFVAFVERVGPDLLVRMGFDEGSELVGGIIRRGGSLTDEALQTVDHVGDDLFRIGADFSDEAGDGLGVVSHQLDEPEIRGFFDGVGCVLSAAAATSSNHRFASLAAHSSLRPLEASEGCEIADEAFKVFGESAKEIPWNGQSWDGAQKIIKNAETAGEDGPAKIQRLINSIGDPDVANRTLSVASVLSKNWSDDALEGISVMLRHLDGDTEKVVRILKGSGGTAVSSTGERLFRIIREGEASAIGGGPRWDGFLRKMAGVSEEGGIGNLWGNSNVLFFIDENGGFSEFSNLEVYLTDGTLSRFYDLKAADGAFYELKNVANVGTGDYDQMIVDLQLLNDGDLRQLHWVFRGEETDLPFSKSSFIDGVRDRILRRTDLTDSQQELIRRLDQVFTKDHIEFTGTSRPYP
jgi:hypothetical protein